MSNQSKFYNLQTDPCDLVIPEEKPIDRVCPTCIPDSSYKPPKWWKQKEPWLNKQTCEYSMAVYVTKDGEYHRLSDLKDKLSPIGGETSISKDFDNEIINVDTPQVLPTSGQAQEVTLKTNTNISTGKVIYVV